MSPSDAPLCQTQPRLPPFHSFSATHCALAFDQAHICGYLYGAVQTVAENDSDPRRFFSNSIMVSRYCLGEIASKVQGQLGGPTNRKPVQAEDGEMRGQGTGVLRELSWDDVRLPEFEFELELESAGPAPVWIWIRSPTLSCPSHSSPCILPPSHGAS